MNKLSYILNLYKDCLGQMINREKTSFFSSMNTLRNQKQIVMAVFGVTREASNEKCLSLSVHVGQSKEKTFEYIKQKIWNRIQGWKEKMLSKAGKEILIKAVAQAIPTYAMSCFDLQRPYVISSTLLLCDFGGANKTWKIKYIGLVGSI